MILQKFTQFYFEINSATMEVIKDTPYAFNFEVTAISEWHMDALRNAGEYQSASQYESGIGYHQRQMLKHQLEHIAFLSEQIDKMDEEIKKKQNLPKNT